MKALLRLTRHLALLAFALGAGLSFSQADAEVKEGEGPGGPRKPGRGGAEGAAPGGPGGGGPGGGKMRRPGGAGGPGSEGGVKMGLKDLSEEERTKIREAMRAVWEDSEVKAARENLSSASRQYRESLHAAMDRTDPEIRPLLERMFQHQERMGSGGSGAPFGGGNPFDMMRGEVSRALPEDLRGRFAKVHEQVMSEGLSAKLESTRDVEDREERKKIFMEVRSAYRAKMITEFPEMGKVFERIDAERAKRGGTGPNGGGPGVGPGPKGRAPGGPGGPGGAQLPRKGGGGEGGPGAKKER